MVVRAPFDDIEPVVVELLTNAVAGIWPCTELPPAAEFNRILAEVGPICQVTRLGGTTFYPMWNSGPLLDRPLIDFDVYGPSRQATNAAVKSLRGAVAALKGASASGVGVVNAVENAGPSYRPDASQNITRIGFTADLTVRPIPA